MHITRLSQARRILPGFAAVLGLLLLAGCNLTITNLTSDVLRENPSQLYTIAARVNLKSNDIDRSSVQVSVVIDGQNQAMRKSQLTTDVYEYDYPLPAGRDEAAYYFLVRYRFNSNTRTNTNELYTPVTHFKVMRRYALPLEANRGPVGARVSIGGRGFTPQDVVYLDATPARTVYESPSSISFFVPPIVPDRNYNIALSSGGSSTLSVGVFRADSSGATVTPSALTLRTGEQVAMTFTVPTAAPQGGLLLDVTTDIPESVIMPEVVVPEGATSVVVTVQAGKPGAGALYLKGFGQGDTTIPVSVSAQ
jgi:outer membrane murein-binding lipoprotein Lpp